MIIGKLRRRVTIQRKVATQSDFGEEVINWTDVATVWAAIDPLSGREITSQQRAEALMTHRVTIRRRGDLSPSMRVVEGGSRVMHIEAILESNKPGEMVLMCVGVVDG